jgi:uncharacterized protein (DUF58 family)
MSGDEGRQMMDDNRSPSIVPRPGSRARSSSRVSKRTFHVTRAGWTLFATCILLTMGAINSGLNVTYLLAGLTITIFLAGVIAPLWNGRGVDFRREILEPPYAGEPFNYTLVVTGRRVSVARLARFRDPLGGPKSESQLVARIPAKGTVRIPCVGAPLRRGPHPMPPVEWRSGFPFGLAECGRWLGDGAELLVYPARGRLEQSLASPAKPVAARAGVRRVTGVLTEDFRSLREYRPGDSLRRVHWRASAHRGRLHVRELERERFAPTLILLDSRIPAGLNAEKPPDPGALSEREQAEQGLELAVSFAAEVARLALRQGNNVTIVGYFPQPAVLTAARRGDFRFESDEFSATKCAKAAKKAGAEAARPDASAAIELDVLRLESSRGRSFDRLMEALARLTPSDADTADALPALASRARLNFSGRVVGVSPTPATAQSLRIAFAGRPAEIYAATEANFSEVFRLMTGARRHER